MSLRKLLIWITNQKWYSWFLKSILPYIRFSTYYPSFTGKQFHRAEREIQPADIILCRDDKKLTSFLIGGSFSHAALCVGYSSTGRLEVMDLTHEDMRRIMLFDIAKESDRVVILRCNDFDNDYIAQVCRRARTFYNQGIKYDVGFKLGIKSLYCSELVYECDFERRLKVSLEDMRSLGRKYISPDGLYKAKNVRKIYDSNEL